MVRGLATFKKHFAKFDDQYVLIGGAASAEIMEQSGLEFRVTRDLDIVLIVEVITQEFVVSFWDFIQKGKYRNKHQSDNKRKYYRFENPEDKSYPECIELFSRIPDCINFEGQGHITPIPMEAELSSLSAILINDEYYQLILNGRIEIDGLSCLRPEYIILLKIKAWHDMNERLANGESIDSKNIKKHRNDVLRLILVLEPDVKVDISEPVRTDLQNFFHAIEKDSTINLKNLNIKQVNIKGLVNKLKQIFGLIEN